MKGGSFLALFVALWMLLVSAAAPAQTLPAARAGRLELAAVPQEPLPLRGEWGFAWHSYLDPGWQQLPTQAMAPVPSHWNDLTVDGKPPGEDGWGSYALLVDCPRGQSLAVEALGERTASRLFVNGTLVAQHGTLGTSAADTRAAVHNRVP